MDVAVAVGVAVGVGVGLGVHSQQSLHPLNPLEASLISSHNAWSKFSLSVTHFVESEGHG